MGKEIHFLRGELSCPHCRNNVLEVVSDGFQTNFLCGDCWTCWHWDFGWMAHVPALSCRGCGHKTECLRRNEERMAA
jgi:hypothetical protein